MEDGERTGLRQGRPGLRTEVAGTDGNAGAESAVPPVRAGPNRTPEGPSPFRLGNRPCLTGIRAVGIIAVLIYHSNFKTLPGTWTMLQMFFVLSGFLITAMLNSEGQP